MAYTSLLLITLSTLLFLTVSGRVITTTSSSDIVSDGVHHGYGGILRLNPFISVEATEACKSTYGFLPFTNTTLGSLFLVLVYGYLMFLAAMYLSSGSELLLHMLGPGLVGGLLVPIFGAVPEAMIILASGLSGNVKVAQDQVSVGMGLLAGSTVMLVTVLWGACECSGVSTDIWTSYSAMIMAVSVLPLIVLQLPLILHSTSGRHVAVLIGLIMSVSLLIAYCVYQVTFDTAMHFLRV
ncbi:hypothetical protein L2E82_25767 [Cichorium intybus]|uniref:Uncharacterized protein n=1 Tax=Cichorium intybus TaxID=13427 RepID=A0ACB9E4K4_CICIN|nr:hypothetical protein L2E82_25767 [Cichorium intybus]